ncbi:MAG TPA: hypothetical protein PKN64_15825, partial [Casimicrobium sp.]|nr:hypothetical protein [Casimicrobium sp.]
KRAECGRHKVTVQLLDKEAEELKKATAALKEQLAKSEFREALESERSSALRSLGTHTARNLHVLLAAASVAESLASAARTYAANVADSHPDCEDARRVVVYLDAVLDALQGAL